MNNNIIDSKSDWFNEAKQRQVKAVSYTKENGKISNSEYCKINNCARNTASKDLSDLVSKEIFVSSGTKGAEAFYTLK